MLIGHHVLDVLCKRFFFVQPFECKVVVQHATAMQARIAGLADEGALAPAHQCWTLCNAASDGVHDGPITLAALAT